MIPSGTLFSRVKSVNMNAILHNYKIMQKNIYKIIQKNIYFRL